METVATTTYVMKNEVQMSPLPVSNMKTPASCPAELHWGDWRWEDSGNGYERWGNQSWSDWADNSWKDNTWEEGKVYEKEPRARRRGGRRNKGRQASGSDLTTPSSSPAKVGLQERDFEEHSEEVTRILRRLETEEGKQEVLEELKSPETSLAAMTLVCEAALSLATSKTGTWVVQKALELASPEFRSVLQEKLTPYSVELYESPHGNFVLSKAIEMWPQERLSPMVATLKEHGFEEVAKHKYGCRLMERLIEWTAEKDRRTVMDCITPHAESLSKHQYGNFVVQHLYEHAPYAREAILAKILPQVSQLAMHRTASHVVQTALTYSEAEGRAKILQVLLAGEGEESLVKVAQGRYGSFVVEQLKQELPPNAVACVERCLSADLEALIQVPFGRRVAETFGLVEPQPTD
mmetsp:Transcript_617/g.1278  ORF Transcript_617/g.1278 Transcript_617/m.1278 type:complete len:408 (+) Transcript_617:57-1280(+)